MHTPPQGWFPGFQEYRELVSCSNCLDYQSRAMEIRVGSGKDKSDSSARKQYAHMVCMWAYGVCEYTVCVVVVLLCVCVYVSCVCMSSCGLCLHAPSSQPSFTSGYP